MKIKAIIFDLDGVLVSTDHFHYQAWKQMADSIGVYFDEKINERLRGVSRMASLDIILEQYQGSPLDQKQKEELAAKKNDIYKSLLAKMQPSDVSEEVRETLADLHEKGYLLAIGSSSQNAKFILDRVQLRDCFDAISDGTNITKSKPDPEVFLKAAGFLGVSPEECMVVEDAYAGIDAAKSGNMYAAGIGSAVNYERADIALKTFGDLKKYM